MAKITIEIDTDDHRSISKVFGIMLELYRGIIKTKRVKIIHEDIKEEE